MAAHIKELDKDNFSHEISKGKWAVDFWAAWCAPCRQMGPHFEEAAHEFKDVHFAKLDAQNNSIIAQNNNIRGIPCIVFFKDGKEVGRSVGLVGKEDIVERTRKAFG